MTSSDIYFGNLTQIKITHSAFKKGFWIDHNNETLFIPSMPAHTNLVFNRKSHRLKLFQSSLEENKLFVKAGSVPCLFFSYENKVNAGEVELTMQEIPWEHRTNCVLQGTGIAWTQPPFLAKAQWRGQIANKRRHDKTELRSSELPQPRVKKGEGCIQSVQKTAAEEENQQIAELPRRAEQVGWVMQHPAFPLPLKQSPTSSSSHHTGTLKSSSLPSPKCCVLHFSIPEELFHNRSQLWISGLETFQIFLSSHI